MRLLKYIKECHIFFIRESKTFVGVPKPDYSKSFPIWGENYWWRKFNSEEHERFKYTIVDVGHPTKYVYRLKDLLFYPIAYFRFMYYSIKHFK